MNILERLDSRGSSTAPRWLRLAGGALLAAFLTATLASCSSDTTGGKKGTKSKRGGEDASEEENGGSTDEIAEEVEANREKAKKLGAEQSFSDTVAVIDRFIASAEDSEGEASTKKYKQANSRLKRLIDDQLKLNEDVKKLAPVLAGVEAAKKQAEAAKAAENSPVLYKEGQDLHKKATDALTKPTPESVHLASRSLLQAKDRFDQAAISAADSILYRKGAEEEKAAMLKYKEMAQAKQADEKAAADWLQARQAEREADRYFALAEFQTATEIYRQATRQFQGAVQAVQSDEENRLMMEKMEAEAVASAAQQERFASSQAAEADPVPFEPRGTPVAVPIQTPVPQAAPLLGGGAPIPEGFDPEVFKQDLDAEDEAFLTEHYRKLTPSGIIQYDVSTGAVSLDYTLGKDVKADALLPGMQKAWINFKPLFAPSRNQTPEEQRENAAYSFEGNTQGLMIFPVPLRFFARIEWDMGIGTMDNSASFNVLSMYDMKKKGAFMTDWLRIGIMRAGLPRLSSKGLDPQFLKPANEWFLKTRDIPMKVEYQMSDLKTGKFTVTYDVDGDDEVKQSITGTNYTRGYIAFKWSRVKFRVVALRISGILDKEEAVAKLRMDLKMPKAKASKEKEEPEPEPEPTTSGGEEDGAEPTGAGGSASAKGKPAGGVFEH
ncbi:MAG TPA: hypothetical protein VMT52_05700 [Planctomycetota bacterium]|nr:hypothetical protein [Planctomycetota bacterium]